MFSFPPHSTTAVSFSNLEAKVYGFDNRYIYIGTVTRPERMMVPAKSTAMMTATGVFPTSLELGASGGPRQA
jgi:hypothetical protein